MANNTNNTNDPFADGFNDAIAPRHADESYLQFLRTNAREVPREGERHFWQADGFRTRRSQTLMEMVTGAMAKPEDIKIKCKGCGQFETVFYRCYTCEGCICPFCACSAPGDRSIRFCEKHFNIYILQFDHWQALRIKKSAS